MASIPRDDITATSLLPSGFKPKTPKKPVGPPPSGDGVLIQDDISKFLPPGFKPTTTTTSTTETSLLDEILSSIESEDLGPLLPSSGFKPTGAFKPSRPF